MSISIDCDGDNMTFEDGDNNLMKTFAMRFEDDDESDKQSSHQKLNSGETSTASNESISNGMLSDSDEEDTYMSENPHDVKPNVAEEFKPNYDMRFRSVEDAIYMFKEYAAIAGFDVRKTTLRKIGDVTIHRYLVCSRNGKLPVKSVEDSNRNTSSKVTDCRAKIVIKRIDGSGAYKFERFQENHNHELEESNSYHLKKSRKLSFSDKEYIVRAGTAKIGATKAYKLKATLNGGFEHVRGKKTDYKNFKRDLGNTISFRDAQIAVNKLMDRKENYPNYSFYYECDENSVLRSVFWADETDKAYYSEFGDVMSFDATFRTNKYALIFVPFTVIDHHKSSVTVGAGLLSNETIESYKWLLQQFLKAHGKQPKLVLTDQDAALKQAIESVFPTSKHRLCMWHIMKKLQGKLSVEFLKTTDFKKEFKKLVWDVNIEPEMFEYNWDLLIKKYKLEEMRWFHDLFEIRHSWIPAYFKEIPMCGMMKTTSRSESMNSFFNSYSQSDNFLSNFILNYDNAIQKQRNTQRELDHTTKRAQYVFKSPCKMEQHAAKVYTSRLFFEVQKELFRAAWKCDDIAFSEGNGWEIYTIIHKNKNNENKRRFKVELKLPEYEIKCSCEHFLRFGILCRHVLKILIKKDLDEIPEQYILRRWRKDVISSNYNLGRDRFDERDDDVTKMVNEVFYTIESCVDLVRDDKEKLSSLVKRAQGLLKDLKEDSKSDSSSEVSRNNFDVVEKLMGVSIPEKVDIKVPEVQNNKGSRKKRLVGELESAILQSSKTRMCSVCHKREPHNSRTCPERKKDL